MANVNKLEGKFSNHPLPSSVVIHGEGSNNVSGGVRALILQDVDTYDPVLCMEPYRKYGLPTPPADDQTVQWLRESQHPNSSKGFVFLQSADKAMPFIPFDKCGSPHRLIITIKAYWKLLSLFCSPRPNESEWMRLERKAQSQLDAMRSTHQVISLGPYLSYVSHGSNTFSKPIETYKDWTLVLESYSQSLWSKDTPSQVTLRYIPTGKMADPLGATTAGAHVRLFSNVLSQISQENVMNFLKKCVREGYYTTASPPTPLSLPPLQPAQQPIADILAKATAAAQISGGKDVVGGKSSSSSEEGEHLEDSYSMPVLAAVETKKSGGGGGKTTLKNNRGGSGKSGGKDSKPYDRQKQK